MALKTDDIDIDALLISYELEKLNLDNVPDDILNLPELSRPEQDVDEDFSIEKFEKVPNGISAHGVQDIKPDVSKLLTCDKTEPVVEFKKVPSSSNCVSSEINLTKVKSTYENNKENIVIKEETSDSDSDEYYDSQESHDETEDERENFPFTLRSRGPVKVRKRSKKRYEEYAKQREGCTYFELDKEKLLHKAGGQCIQLNKSQAIKNQISSTESLLLNDLTDQYYQNSSNNLHSPESGYATSPSSASLHLADQSCSTFSIHKSLSDDDETCILDGVVEMIAENKGGIVPASVNVETIKQFLEDEKPEDVEEPSNGTCLQNSKLSFLKCKPIGNKAKKRLYAELCKEKYEEEKEKIYRRLQHTEVIYVPDEQNSKENQSNLHLAVLNSNIEEIYCIVEIHKQYNKPFSDINNRDNSGKVRKSDCIRLCSGRKETHPGGRLCFGKETHCCGRLLNRKYSSTRHKYIDKGKISSDYFISGRGLILRTYLELFNYLKINKKSLKTSNLYCRLCKHLKKLYRFI